MRSDDPGLRRLANAVLLPGLCGDDLQPWLLDELAGGLGGVCWFVGERHLDVADVAALMADVHAANPSALVTVDEEGGTVTRLETATGSSWPGASALGAYDDLAATTLVGAAIGALARAAGCDVVLAPDVDVNSEPRNPVIGVRSFGSDSALVARHGVAFVDGVHSQGVAACAKHFPGHGDTHVDSHVGLPTVALTRERFFGEHLAPFAAVVDAGVRALMTAHVVVPAVDGRPATVSPEWMRIVRDELGFDGVVFSDALDMQAISAGIGRPAGAVAALRAGVDVICIGNPRFPEPYDNQQITAAIRAAVIAAVCAGELPLARLEQAAGRAADLSSWVRAAEVQPFDIERARIVAGEVAIATVRPRGAVARGASPLVLIEDTANIAAGVHRSPLPAALAERDAATRAASITAADITVADVTVAGSAPSGDPWGLSARQGTSERESDGAGDHAGGDVILVTDGLGGTAVLDAVRRRWPDAVVVHTGAPSLAAEVTAPAIVTNGMSALAASAAAPRLVPTVR